jgi:hypothetical protein
VVAVDVVEGAVDVEIQLPGIAPGPDVIIMVIVADAGMASPPGNDHHWSPTDCWGCLGSDRRDGDGVTNDHHAGCCRIWGTIDDDRAREYRGRSSQSSNPQAILTLVIIGENHHASDTAFACS